MVKFNDNMVVVTGNMAAAVGAALSKPDIIAAYPITPQSSVVESLAEMVANGRLDSRVIEVESEHSAMSVVQGASLAGARTFTATSAQGLALMYEPYFRMSTLRLPMVMAIAGREMTSPETVWGSQQDSISVRDAGWIQIYVENNQEILDMIIQGYKIAENEEVLIPVNICYDGFYLSHLVEPIEIPSVEEVNNFLPPYEPYAILDPEQPMVIDPLTPGDILYKYRRNHLNSMNRALEVIDEIDQKFSLKFGRSYGGTIEEYRCKDAETLLITMGSITGTAKVAIDEKRKDGVAVGLIKVRSLRPFPRARIRKAIKDKKAILVVDKNVCFGWNSGVLFMETMAAISNLNKFIAAGSAIGGLGGKDVTLEHFHKCIEVLERMKDNKEEDNLFPIWL